MPNHPKTQHPDRTAAPVILRIREVQARTGLARPTLYKLIQQKRFPAGVDLLGTGRAVGWEERAVTEWINERIKAARIEPPVQKAREE